MPYLPEAEKAELQNDPNAPILKSGRLNFLITLLLIRYWKNSPQNYQAINDIVGAIEGAKQEFYRRIAVPYENEKIKQNGDVYHG